MSQDGELGRKLANNGEQLPKNASSDMRKVYEEQKKINEGKK